MSSYDYDDAYNECYNIISQCDCNSLVRPDDDIDYIINELLEFVKDYDWLTEEGFELYSQAMRDAWRDYDEW